MSHTKIHEEVQVFLRKFHEAFHKKETKKLSKFYESDFQRNSSRYYEKDAWPNIASVQYCIKGKKDKKDEDDLFYLFYKELRFRHIYSNRNLSKTITQNVRDQSYRNYVQIFEVIRNQPESCEVPNQWLWDMTDEFIYQFQMYHLVRLEGGKQEHRVVQLPKVEKRRNATWGIPSVLNMFEENVEVSGIEEVLHKDENVMKQKFRTRLILGYFSQIALLRLNCMLGDYYNAVKSINFINLHKSSIFTSIHSCNIALYYFASFCFFMLRRYVTCIRLLSSLLLHNERHRRDTPSSKTSYSWESAIRKRIDQSYSLLAIAINICPTKIDDSVYNLLKSRMKDPRSNLVKGKRLVKGDLATFEDMFRFAHPRFFVFKVRNSQVDLFIREMINQRVMFKNKKYVMKSMSSVSLDRFKNLMGDPKMEPEEYLCCMKHKSRQIIFTKNQPPLLEGKVHVQIDADFCVDDEKVIFSLPRERNVTEILVKRINRIKELLEE